MVALSPDAVAVRAAAVGGLTPLHADDAMPECVTHVLAVKGFDRSAMVRKRWAATLLAWGAERIVQSSMTQQRIASVLALTTLPGNLDCIGPLLVQFLQSSSAVHWLRTLNVLGDEGYAPFLARFQSQFVPKLVFCAFGSSSGGDGDGDEDADESAASVVASASEAQAELEDMLEAEIQWSASSE